VIVVRDLEVLSRQTRPMAKPQLHGEQHRHALRLLAQDPGHQEPGRLTRKKDDR